MDLINEWLLAASYAEAAKQNANEKLEKALTVSLPETLVEATSDDIKTGVIIWYPECEGDENGCWKLVEEVLRPSDMWKAYVAHDGCRYGLDGAFVEGD